MGGIEIRKSSRLPFLLGVGVCLEPVLWCSSHLYLSLSLARFASMISSRVRS